MKKTYLYLAVCLGFVVSCSSGGGDDDPTPAENKAPSTPSQVYPLNNTLCIDNAVIFEWNASTDPEGNSISYKIEISENSSFTALAFNETSTTNSRLISIPKGKAFYWRVKALDSKQAESGYSSVSQFLNEGEGVSPDLVAPALNSEIDGISTTLSWTASDADNDALTYDVYLDTTSNPTTKVSENQTDTNYTVNSLAAASTYYFKVVVKDDNGGPTIGQIWSFKTK